MRHLYGIEYADLNIENKIKDYHLEMWKIGNKYMVADLQNVSIDEIVETLNIENLFNRLNTLIVDPSYVKMLYPFIKREWNVQ